MLHVELVTLWDLVRVKLGRDPHLGIPLFNGLSRTQVHYILTAGAIREFHAGEVLFHRGDPSDFMYAILAGTLDVVEPLGDGDTHQTLGVRKFIKRLGPGELVGEMGLIRSAPRSATVIAAEAGELLQINWKMIKRLQWLFPPTAHRFFYNLMSIICDRLEQATYCLADESRVDDLTGLYNKKGFFEILEKETHRAQRYNMDLSLCLIGIDLETGNPHSGYEAKDRILTYLAGILSRQIRKSDTLGRLETQSFALLLPQTPMPEAEQICDRLWHPLDKELFEAAGMKLTVTFGWADLSDETDEAGVQLVATAKEMLRSAREAGQYRLLPVGDGE